MDFKKYFVSILKSKIVKMAVVRLIGVSAGFKAWVLSMVLKYIFDLVAVPIINLAIRKGMLVYDTARGKIIVKKLKKAKEDGNEDDYDDIVDDL